MRYGLKANAIEELPTLVVQPPSDCCASAVARCMSDVCNQVCNLGV